MEEQRRVAFVTLGCKVNTTETEGMRNLFEAAGYRCVPADGMADVYVINTCTVTNMGDRKSRQMIRHSRALNPDAVVAAVGCYAQVSPDEVAAVQGVDLVLGNNRKHLIVPLAEEAARMRAGLRPAESPSVEVRPRKEMTDFETLPQAAYQGQTRAFLKIQDGCDRFCSYCIIPYARGPVRSRKPDEILEEARSLVARGFTEMVLTGIHLTSFRDGNGEEALPTLIQALDQMPGIARIRLGSLEPVFLSEPVLDVLVQSGKLCPHFHLSLQSGSASVLKRMNRRYDPSEFAQVVASVRARFPEASITTDVMVGFPGESEEEFEESLAFCESMGFSWMHVFPYSPPCMRPLGPKAFLHKALRI